MKWLIALHCAMFGVNNFMKTQISLFFILFLSACGSAQPEAAQSLAALTESLPEYCFKAEGTGATFAAGIYANFGLENQIETNIGSHQLQGSSEETCVSGIGTVAQFVLQGGNILQVSLYKNGELVEVKNQTNVGSSIQFSFEAE